MEIKSFKIIDKKFVAYAQPYWIVTVAIETLYDGKIYPSEFPIYYPRYHMGEFLYEWDFNHVNFNIGRHATLDSFELFEKLKETCSDSLNSLQNEIMEIELSKKVPIIESPMFEPGRNPGSYAVTFNIQGNTEYKFWMDVYIKNDKWYFYALYHSYLNTDSWMVFDDKTSICFDDHVFEQVIDFLVKDPKVRVRSLFIKERNYRFKN